MLLELLVNETGFNVRFFLYKGRFQWSLIEIIYKSFLTPLKKSIFEVFVKLNIFTRLFEIRLFGG